MITSLSEDFAIRKANLQEYHTLIDKVNKFVDNVGDKITNRIEKHKQKYLEDYKEKVSMMTAELKAIRAVLDQQQLKQRSNQRLFHLQQERDFFRAQVIKLNEDLRKAKQEITKLKSDLSQTKHQSDNYRKIAYDLETKIYKLTYQNIEMEKIKEENNIPSTTAHQTKNSGFFVNGNHQQPSLRSNQKTLRQSELINQQRNGFGLERTKTQYSLRKLKPSKSLGGSTPNILKVKAEIQPTKRQQILDECIKQIKKQIYYRNLSNKQSMKVHFNEENKINFNKFTKSDKKQLVYRFMSNPQILEGLYQFVFDKNRDKQVQNASSVKGLEKLMIAKGADAKFNTKMLLNYKNQFDKKIYDIKANRY